MSTLYDINVHSIDDKEISLRSYEGSVLLVVNTASRCGFTPQYKALEELHKEYAPRGFAVLGFPCNQFAAQEPGDAEEIKKFCELTYNVSFPLFAKVAVNGDDAAPLFKFLKTQAKGVLNTEAIKWNFTKFLIDKKGNVIARYAPSTSPLSLKSEIEALL